SLANNSTVLPLTFASGTFTLPATLSTNPFAQNISITIPVNATASSLYSASTYTRRAVGGVIVRLPGEWKAEADYTWNQTGYTYSQPRNTSAALATDVTSGAIDVVRDLSIAPPNFSSYLIQPAFYFPNRLKSTLRDATLRAGGPLFDLPAGSVSVA